MDLSDFEPPPLPPSSSPPPSQDLLVFLNNVVKNIQGGENAKQLEELAQASTPSVCGKVWKSNETAYKCRTCEMDPTWYVILFYKSLFRFTNLSNK